MTNDISCDVLVVGAGPAGLSTAITLARTGIDVLVVERHRGTSPFPKATGISTRTMEIFRSWGIEGKVRAGAIDVRPVMIMSRTLTSGQGFVAPFGYPTDEQALAVSPCTPCCCPQDHLEPVLVEHLRERGGRIRFGVEVVALTCEPTGVHAELVDLRTGGRNRVLAEYVIGADGPRSMVRSAVGIGIHDMGTIGEFVAVTFRADLARLLPDLPGAINSVDIPGAEGVFVPTGAGHRWIYAREWQPAAGDQLTDWTADRCLELIRTASGVPDLEPEILSVMPFTMGGHVADSFGGGRAFLVGDAAHRTTPVGGTGMNTAIHAAQNLGWRLGLVLGGWAGESLLDGYEHERRPVGIRNVTRSLRMGPPAPGEDPLAADLGVHYATSAENSGVGTRAPHAWIRFAGQRISTMDLFDGRLTVLTGDAVPSVRRMAARRSAGGMPIQVVSVGKEVQDPDGELGRKLGLGSNDVLLVRPDGFVAWRGGADVAALSASIDELLCQQPAQVRRAG